MIAAYCLLLVVALVAVAEAADIQRGEEVVQVDTYQGVACSFAEPADLQQIPSLLALQPIEHQYRG